MKHIYALKSVILFYTCILYYNVAKLRVNTKVCGYTHVLGGCKSLEYFLM